MNPTFLSTIRFALYRAWILVAGPAFRTCVYHNDGSRTYYDAENFKDAIEWGACALRDESWAVIDRNLYFVAGRKI